MMDVFTPLEQLYDVGRGPELSLPDSLATLYGPLRFPIRMGRPYIFGNVVSTLDGVVAFNDAEGVGGGDISGHNMHDRFVMALLRSVADAVIVGAGTQRAVPRHRWTAQYIYPALAGTYQQLRQGLSKAPTPLNVIVSAEGNVNLKLPVFQLNEVEVLLVTTERGQQRLSAQSLPPSVRIVAVQSNGRLSARSILQAVGQVRACDLLLVEGGPLLMADFFAERLLDELFLTLAPQVAGRTVESKRPGLVMGKLFAPEQPLWGQLISIKRAGSHLFLRYAYLTPEHDQSDLPDAL